MYNNISYISAAIQWNIPKVPYRFLVYLHYFRFFFFQFSNTNILLKYFATLAQRQSVLCIIFCRLYIYTGWLNDWFVRFVRFHFSVGFFLYFIYHHHTILLVYQPLAPAVPKCIEFSTIARWELFHIPFCVRSFFNIHSVTKTVFEV